MSDSSQKPARGRPKTLRKADVVDVAMRAYWEDGPTEVSLNAICQRAGVSKPSVYREFGNDDGLTSAALEHYAQCVLAEILNILGRDGGFADKIRDVARLVAEGAEYEGGCLFVKMRAAKPRMGEKTQALIDAIDRMALDAFAKVLAEARERGEWSASIPDALGAQYLHAQIGLALDQRARGEDPKATLALALSVFDLVEP